MDLAARERLAGVRCARRAARRAPQNDGDASARLDPVHGADRHGAERRARPRDRAVRARRPAADRGGRQRRRPHVRQRRVVARRRRTRRSRRADRGAARRCRRTRERQARPPRADGQRQTPAVRRRPGRSCARRAGAAGAYRRAREREPREMAPDALDGGGLERLPLLESMPADVRAQVRRRFVRAAHPFGAVIVREGEPADALYVIASGRARVVKRGDNGDDVPLNVLRAGDVFGEMGLLEHTTRTATVRASSDVEVWRLDRHVFEELLVTWPDLKKYLELQASRRRLQNFFRFYTAFTRLPVDALGEMLGQLEPVTAAA